MRPTPGSLPRTPDSAAADLDAALFQPTGWFCLNSGNQRVPGVRAGSLRAALALVGQGTVTTVAGLLRSEFCVVDVDAAGATGDAVRTALLAWCADRDLWALSRASGGGPGRCHVFCRPGVHRAALRAAVDHLRAEHGLSARAVDLRRQVRPLSAPHRTGAASPVPGGLRAALRALQALSGQPSQPLTAAQRPPRTVGPPYEPLARPSRALPTCWQRYLEHGELPDAAADWADRSNSTAERVATFWLVVSGLDEPAAWTAIAHAHPAAFTKARERGRSWWRKHVWHHAGQAADSWLSQQHQPSSPAGGRPRPDPLAATAAARAALDQQWLSWGRDERHALRAVLEVLLDRMDRTGTTTVPCPERDLLLDTPLRSRNTIRTALQRLQVLGFGQRLATFVPGSPDPDHASHTFALDKGFCSSNGSAVRLLAPPTSHTPPARVPRHPGLWRLLGLPARHTYQAVLRYPGMSVTELAPHAGLVHGPDSAPTSSQLRTLDGHLQTLAGLGLLQVEPDGTWSPAVTAELGLGVLRPGQAAQQAVDDAVSAEREAYRQRLRSSDMWARQRDAAHARAAKVAQRRQRAWWAGLTSDQREQRRYERTAVFAQLSLIEQAALKTRLAEQRRRAGVDEEQRRRDWIGAQPADAYAERVIECTVRFAGLPPTQQAASVATWQAHRDRFGLSRRRSPTEPLQRAASPDVPDEDVGGQLVLL